MALIERLKRPGDIKDFSYEELPALCSEIRELLIDTLSIKGGHLSSNLGAVELTVALHRVFSPPKDKLIFDVGHQSYTHKILTGRREELATLRDKGGLSGFPKRSESDCDAFDSGHASNSLSAGLGMATARDLMKEDYKVISVIGDGALTGGLAYEAMNNAGSLKTNFIIVLNDNGMSISENVGGLSRQLASIRTSNGYTNLKAQVQSSLERIPVYGEKLVAQIRKTKSGIKQLVIPGMIFEQMGIMYLGPVDGSNIKQMENVLKNAARYKGCVLVHVITKKGKGYLPAERHPSRFHGADPFDRETGLPLSTKDPSYTDIFSTVIRKLGQRDEKVCCITAAMMDGTGLKRFRNLFPERFFDVGIAEEHAVTFAAGLALSGMKPVVCIYSSFLQRSYDEILMDVCMQDLHVVFAIDRAGVVGHDGPTHHGLFDLSYLSSMPNMIVLSPKNKWELSDMLKYALSETHPVAVRYPRGCACTLFKEKRQEIVRGRSEVIEDTRKGKGGVVILALGRMVENAYHALSLLKDDKIGALLVNARFVKPIDTDLLDKVSDASLIVTVEDNVVTNGFGSKVGEYLLSTGYKGDFLRLGFPDEFIPQGDCNELYDDHSLSPKGIYQAIREKVSADGKGKA